MHEINAEIINGEVYLSVKDLVALCLASINGNDASYDQALKKVASEIKSMETEAYENILPETVPDDQKIFAPLG